MVTQEKLRILFILPKPEDPKLIAGLVAKFPNLEPTYICTGTQYGVGDPGKGRPLRSREIWHRL